MKAQQPSNPGRFSTVQVDGTTYTAGDGDLVNNGDGTWTLSIPAANILAENLYQVIATVTDPAGNSALDPGVDDLRVDLTAPPTPGVTSLTTNDTTPVLEGTAVVAAGETLTVSVNGIAYIAGDGNLVDNADGTWVLSIPTLINEGVYNVTATITDIAGNASTDPSASELLIDTTTPVTPTATPLITSDTTPAISGTANAGPGETLTVTVDGTTYTAGDGNLVNNGDGTWDLIIPTPLAESTYEVVVTVTDAAGNDSTDSSSDELVIDLTASVAPTVNTLNTSNSTPVISGTTSTVPGETLSVTVNGVTYVEGDANLVVNSDGTWELTIPAVNALIDGPYDITATITDLAGNTTADSTASELIIDTTPPVIPGVIPQNTSNTTPVISGTAIVAPGETLTVAVDGITYTAGDGNLIDNGDGTWTLTVPTALTDSTYSVTVSVIDTAGNSSNDTTTAELVIDSTAPALPTVATQYTNDTTPVMTGTAVVAAGETLTVTIGGTVYMAGDGNLADNGDGSWSLAIQAPLPESVYDVIATITDSAGNASSDITVSELTIDTTLPVIPTVTSLTTNDTKPTISGTATVDSGETLTVTVDGVTYTAGDGFLVNNGDGSWELTLVALLTEGAYDIVATVTDLSGNATSDTTSGELIIDFTAPTAPGVTSLITTDTTPLIEGTATMQVGEILTVEVNGVTFTAGDGDLLDNGDGTWALTIPATNLLAESLYQVIATVTDVSGNSAVDPGVNDLLVDLTAPDSPGVTSLTTNNTSPVVEGTVTLAPGDILSVEINGVTYTAGDGNLTDNGDGSWSLTIQVPIAEGLYDVTAITTDTAGNISTDSSSGELLIDTTLPIAPTVLPLQTNDSSPVISGTANTGPGETLTVTVDGVTYTVGDGHLTSHPDGTWALAIPVSLIESTYPVTVTVIDVAGNASNDSTSGELIIDTTGPLAPTVVSQSTNNSTPVIEGTATLAPGETLTVTVYGVTYTAGDGNLVVNGDGTWALTLTMALPDGSYDVVATITDEASNTVIDNGTSDLLIDTSSPEIPTAESLITTDLTPELTGTAEVGPGEILTVTVDDTTYTAGDGNLVDNGDGTWTLQLPLPLTETSIEVFSTVTDAVGNTSVSLTSQLTILAPELDDFDNDGVSDATDLDDDNDGIPDTKEGLLDSDGDGRPDYQDLDSDNDGLPDIIEAMGEDVDNNYVVDNFVDQDNNGLSDDLQLFPLELSDSDNDRVPDYRDLDSDNDGLTDLFESGGTDTNSDGRIDNLSDTNGDGADDVHQINGPFGRDTDRDGVVNRLDIDTDNDGIFDLVESGAKDTNNDGILDSMRDTDADGIPDSVDVDITTGDDIDSDGIDDRFDSSINDEPDSDGDGISDFADPDINGDGFAQVVSNNLTLGQALPDSNGNGTEDILEAANTGFIKTGLAGHGGCSLRSSSSGRQAIDPLLIILAIISSVYLWRRGRTFGCPKYKDAQRLF